MGQLNHRTNSARNGPCERFNGFAIQCGDTLVFGAAESIFRGPTESA